VDAYVNDLYALQFIEGQLVGGRDAYSPTEEEDYFRGKFSGMGMRGQGDKNAGTQELRSAVGGLKNYKAELPGWMDKRKAVRKTHSPLLLH